MFAPLSHFRPITPLLILLSAAVVVTLTLLGDADPMYLWINWAMAGVLSTGIWHIVSRFSLDGGVNLRAFAISWPLLSLTSNFSYCYFAHTDLFYKNIAQLIAILAILTLFMSLWQRRQAILKHLYIGLIIGLVSILIPHAVLWLLLLPIASYYMRSWSARNMFSTLTGTLLGIWFSYCGIALWLGLPAADSIIQQYAVIMQEDDIQQLVQGIGLWQSLFLGVTALLLVIYSLMARFINTGSVRTSSSILLIATLSLMLIVLFMLDMRHLTTYLNMFALFLSLQLTINQSNLHSALNEWWILGLLLIFTALSVLPFFL